MNSDNTPPGMSDLKLDKTNNKTNVLDLDKAAKSWIINSSVGKATYDLSKYLDLSETDTWKLVSIATMERISSLEKRLARAEMGRPPERLFTGDFIDKPVEKYVNPGIQIFQCPQCNKILELPKED